MGRKVRPRILDEMVLAIGDLEDFWIARGKGHLRR